MFGFNRESPTSILEKPTFAKEEWFRAFYEGNSLIPFTGEGMELCFAIEIIPKEKETDWWELLNSELSPRQLRVLSDAMNAQHKHKGISVSTETYAHNLLPKPKIIDDNRLQGLWGGYKGNFIRMIAQYIRGTTNVNRDKAEQTLEVEKFFKNPRKNGIRIEQLKKALGVMKESLHSPAVQELLREYREGYRDPDFSKNKMNWLSELQSKFKDILLSDLTEAFNNELPKDIKFFVHLLGWVPPFD